MRTAGRGDSRPREGALERTGRTRRKGRAHPDHSARESCRAPDRHRAASEGRRSRGLAGFDAFHAHTADAGEKLASFRAPMNCASDALHRHVGAGERVDQRSRHRTVSDLAFRTGPVRADDQRLDGDGVCFGSVDQIANREPRRGASRRRPLGVHPAFRGKLSGPSSGPRGFSGGRRATPSSRSSIFARATPFISLSAPIMERHSRRLIPAQRRLA